MNKTMSLHDSVFIQRQIDADPLFMAQLIDDQQQPVSLAWIEHVFAELLDAQYIQDRETCIMPQMKSVLRRLRKRVFSTIMARDLSGMATLDEVMSSMSIFAQWAVQQALAIVMCEMCVLYGQPVTNEGEPLQLLVVAMGKLGAGELNVSSDIDLVFLYEKEGGSPGGTRFGLSAHEFFTRLGKRLICLLSEMTSDGFVFRVDMRLRPNGESGHLVSSLDMLEEYFYVQGRDWERYAWVKARVISETNTPHMKKVCATLQRIVYNFVYRRYLDFAMIDAIRQLHIQIQQQAQKKALLDVCDVKLGRGGIREIEFFVQALQLIRGGQDPDLRQPTTLINLRYLETQHWIASETYHDLYAAYVFLRKLEHRLQYYDDAQTHCLPMDENRLIILAKQMQFTTVQALFAELAHHQQRVVQHFDAMFAEKNTQQVGLANEVWHSLPVVNQSMRARVQQLGYQNEKAVLERLLVLYESDRYQLLPSKNRVFFDQILVMCLESIPQRVKAEQVDETLFRMLKLLKGLNRRLAYLAFLSEYPQAVHRVLRVLSQTQLGTEYLIRYPQLLDELLEPESSFSAIDWSVFKAGLRAQLQKISDPESQMDRLRIVYYGQLFRILLKDLTGECTVEAISDDLSNLVDVVLQVTLEWVWKQLTHRHLEQPRFAMIAYGKLGAKELGYGGDVDLVFVFDDDDANAEMIYTHLARRLITWLTALTPAGHLFDVDLRLRPDGEQGHLVTSLKRFEAYQLQLDQSNQAWSWEHQALTKARFVAGDFSIAQQFNHIRKQALYQTRHPASLAAQVLQMNQLVRSTHDKVVDPVWFDFKYGVGGMIDVEFIVQYWVLLYAKHYPEMVLNTGNLHLLKKAVQYEWVGEDLANCVSEAYRAYRQLQHHLRLENVYSTRVKLEMVFSHQQAVQALWKKVFAPFLPK